MAPLYLEFLASAAKTGQPSGGSPAFVQQQNSEGHAGTPYTLTLGSNVGNTHLVFLILAGPSGSTFGISGGGVSSFTQVSIDSGVEWSFAYGYSTGGSDAVVVTTTGAYVLPWVGEFSGVTGAYLQTNVTWNGGSASSSSQTLDATSSGQLAIAWSIPGALSWSSGPGGSWTNLGVQIGEEDTSFLNQGAYMVTTGAGNITAAFDFTSSGTDETMMVIFG